MDYENLSLDQLSEILGTTIKHDTTNKLITFFGVLSAYTESSQFNIANISPSSTGKTYVPLEVAEFFPKKDVKDHGYCSPTAFFHESGRYDKKRKKIVVDLSRKILIFLDQPHTQLLAHLRPLLSHDKKELSVKITDKAKGAGLRAKEILLKGYPSVIFCTAGLILDEQEATRFFLLSPDSSQEKIKDAIGEKLKRETDPHKYAEELRLNPLRQQLKKRILAIKQERIKEIRIHAPEVIRERFFASRLCLHPRHMRDIGRLVGLVKMSCLFNLWNRERIEKDLITNDEDIENAFILWNPIAPAQEANLPPYLLGLFEEVIKPLYSNSSNPLFIQGVKRQAICQRHYEVYKRPLTDWKLRREILPMFEAAGKLYQDKDPDDSRTYLVYLTNGIKETD